MLPPLLLLLLYPTSLPPPDNHGNPRRIDSFFYLSNVTTTLPDSSGRLWPGNTAEPQGLLYTRCQTPAKELTVRVMDTCPCKQVRVCIIGCSALCRQQRAGQ